MSPNIRKDAEYARRLVHALRREGITVSALPERIASLRPLSNGLGWVDEISKAMRRASVIVLLVSPDSVNSAWGMFTLGGATGLSEWSRLQAIPVVTRENLVCQNLFTLYPSRNQSSY